jgi:hypothetical protein
VIAEKLFKKLQIAVDIIPCPLIIPIPLQVRSNGDIAFAFFDLI